MQKIKITVECDNIESAQKLLLKLASDGTHVNTSSDESEGDESGASVNTNGALDSQGLPWDARIHSSSKKMTAKNVWARRKGVDDALFDAVVAELRAGAPAAAAPAMPTPNNPIPVGYLAPVPAPMAQMPAPAVPQAAPMGFPPVPQPQQVANSPVPAQIATPAAPDVPVAAPVNDISALMMKLQQLFSAGQATPDYINSIVARINGAYQINMGSISDAAGHQHLIDYAFQCIAADGK